MSNCSKVGLLTVVARSESQVIPLSLKYVKSCLQSLLWSGEWIWPKGDASVGQAVGDLLGVCVGLLIDFANSCLYHSLSDHSNGTGLDETTFFETETRPIPGLV